MTLPRLAHSGVLNDLLLYRISRLLSVAGAPVIRLCEGRFGITRREWRLLALLAQQEGLLSSELARLAQLDRARTSRAVTSLVNKQLLRRQPRAEDRRQVTLALTPAGRALHRALFPLVIDINRELLAALPAPELLRLDAALDLLQARAEALARVAVLPKADRRRGGRSPRSLA